MKPLGTLTMTGRFERTTSRAIPLDTAELGFCLGNGEQVHRARCRHDQKMVKRSADSSEISRSPASLLIVSDSVPLWHKATRRGSFGYLRVDQSDVDAAILARATACVA